MSEKKSTEEQVEKIDAIVGEEVLGYQGNAKEEHSGEPEERKRAPEDLDDKLADNRPDQVK